MDVIGRDRSKSVGMFIALGKRWPLPKPPERWRKRKPRLSRQQDLSCCCWTVVAGVDEPSLLLNASPSWLRLPPDFHCYLHVLTAQTSWSHLGNLASVKAFQRKIWASGMGSGSCAPCFPRLNSVHVAIVRLVANDDAMIFEHLIHDHWILPKGCNDESLMPWSL